MTKKEVLVLGAGMVGTCTALELQLRGHAVTLVDRREPGCETSYGNAGVIQREAVEPYAFPREPGTLLRAALNRRIDVRWRLGGLWAAVPQLARYWWHSAPARHRVISRQYASLIAHASTEHQRYLTLADAEDLVRREGLRMVFRTAQAFDAAAADARRLQAEYGIGCALLDGSALARAEPALRPGLVGALHWLDSWSVSDPGELVRRYFELFLARGGRWVRADADRARPSASGWRIDSRDGLHEASQLVVALGPWSDTFVRRLGYRLPLFVKRGYHRHYSGGPGLALPTLDAERGYVLAPQSRGLRLTTGAELAPIDAPASTRQLEAAEAAAGELLMLGRPVETRPWLGSRPCCADMKPLVGPALRHRGLWFNFAHGHQGFTLGPASARLLADLFDGEAPLIDPAGFLPARFA